MGALLRRLGQLMLVTVVCLGWVGSPAMAHPPGATTLSYGVVQWVYDGDTIKVRLDSGEWQRVRLIGINTPEVWPEAECVGPWAARSMRRILPLGTRVALRVDPAQGSYDRYGRELRYVTRSADGRDVARMQVRRGLARVVDYYDRGFARLASYQRTESAARVANRGGWPRCRWRS